MKQILVLCTGNSCRSQIAHGYLEKFCGNKAKVFSAGIETHGVNPLAIKVMLEDGIDISHHTSDLVTRYANEKFDFVITVCNNANERCPVFLSGAKKFHQDFPDPAKAKGSEEFILNEFRHVRDMIKDYTSEFVAGNLE